MEREELCRSLNAYATALRNREEFEKKITELKSRKEKTVDPEYCQFTLIRFYWPFFPLFFVIIAIASVIFGFVNNGEFDESAFTFVICELAFGLFYFIITAFIAAALRNKASKKMYNENIELLNKENERAEEEIKKHEALLDESYRIIADTKDLVPAKYRTAASVMAIRRVLMAGKASTVEEAVELIKQ